MKHRSSLRRSALYSLLPLCLMIVAPTGNAQRKKVLMIGIDGCRPDALEAAQTPNLDALRAKGAYTNLARSVLPTSSGPNWSSMLTGVTPEKHGVTDNSFNGSNFDEYPHFFSRIRELQPDAFLASFVQWTPIHTEIVRDADISLGGLSDAQVAAQGAQLLIGGEPDVIFLHFDDVDHAGHGFGFSPTVPQYIDAIETTDAHIGTVLAALEERLPFASQGTGRVEDWLVIVSTDHGGLGTSHGGASAQERTLFLLLSGPSVPDGETLSPPSEIIDTSPTAMEHLGLPVQREWDWDGVSVLHRIGCPSNFIARALGRALSRQFECGRLLRKTGCRHQHRRRGRA